MRLGEFILAVDGKVTLKIKGQFFEYENKSRIERSLKDSYVIRAYYTKKGLIVELTDNFTQKCLEDIGYCFESGLKTTN